MNRFNLSHWAVTHPAVLLYLLLTTLLAGLLSYLQLGRSEDPLFNVPMMTAQVIWPGASAREVQDHLLNRMEKPLQELEGFDFVRTFARQGHGALTLRLKGRLSKQEFESSWYQARKKIGDIRHQFPEGVQGPFYNDEYNDVYMALLALHGEGYSPAQLLEQAELLKKELQTLPTISKVDILGKQAEKIHIDISSRRLAALGISPFSLMDTLSQQNQLKPAGMLDTNDDRIFTRVSGSLHTLQDVAELPIAVGGGLLPLAEIASISSGYQDPPNYVIRHNGQQVLTIGVTMHNRANILRAGTQLDALLDRYRPTLATGLTLEKYADQPTVVAESVWEFEKSFLEALAIVLAVSFYALGRHAGIVVAASIPLVLGLVLIVMKAAGWNLDRISLGSLIIALGLLVDDAIIAVEMMVVKIEQGWDRLQAASFAYQSTAFPMLTGTLVTIAGFMPVGFAQSIAGEYAGGIFWIVGIALLASWLVAVLFTPFLGVRLLPASTQQAETIDLYASPLYQRLRQLIILAVRHRTLTLACTLLLFIAAAFGITFVQQQFFPTASRPELLIELRLREGASFSALTEQVRQMEKLLGQEKDVPYFTAYLGAGSPRFYMSLEPELPNPGYAQFVVMTSGSDAREALRQRLLTLFAQDEAFPKIRARVLRLEFGPPVGFPVQFRIIGPDSNMVREIAYQVRDKVRQSPLVRDTQLDWNEQVRIQRIQIDQQRARLLGISSSDVANLMQAIQNGLPISQIRRGEELIDLVLRSDSAERANGAQLLDTPLLLRSGESITLGQFAQLQNDFEEPVLWRRNRNMAITVRSDLVDGVQGPYATESIWPSLESIRASLPPGYRIETGGAIEESEKANQALMAVFPLMFLVMLTILMAQLHSFPLMWMVFMTAPLGLIGVVPALLLFNAPFGFVALLGVIALGGMIMRNSVILADQIEQEIQAGSSAWSAIIEATVRRSRPVLLTAAAAILAMIPLSRSIFWGPMAIAIMGGLVIATLLTLAFLPALYATWFAVHEEQTTAHQGQKA
ncbi:efflux RND transporter permease subunit [Candidatus Magnetaquicoccus inordinatus]|uniref:efflux RND transporter permease subunit n=1 Tax=Candidatus Magnetaquicoccus inordinatus TaxID=2496818 RepID=UPI00102BDD56|nr:efflux RND transporter permease subunit [Candidatus Magnetaquicoccus inordinatus]